ncbi:myb family transcription factor PHL8 isoform X2 [Cynara cardunculus var. scolymus]|uniref:myb family transcription factor PHL8 isoform X2 n=1 Tax=Cynara cardunculus var. scolymus TaxID=59895 RepID=UPI000D6256B2|nr:myb family transcription factor PHL8 isoform X2 [Cynara cardunculus var. scolymus]
MAHQNIQNQDLNLVLSSDAKPRLKWTPELHQRFVDSVTQLGGPEKATPKSLMRVMGIHGLTLYHLKSHLQKYRLGKIQQSPACSGNMQEEFADDHRSDITSIDHNDETPNQINDLKIAQALQMQMEVQRKLHEQIEVQRHLQLRIEAQGKYLQSVLRKAQDTLAGYNSSAIEVEAAKAELSHLVSMVDNGCPNSLSVLTELDDSTLKKEVEKNPKALTIGSSLESSLTSSESSGRRENDDHVVLSLMEMNPPAKNGRKRSGSTISDGNCEGKRLQKDSKRFDLNSQYVNDFDFDFESRSNTLDLNSN